MPRPKLRLHDWLFGAGGRRRLLEVVLAGNREGWVEAELATRAKLHKKGSVDVHLRPLVQLGLLTKTGARYDLVPTSKLVRPLRQLLAAVRELPDAEVERPTNR
jgi:hypothetical protein